MSRSLVQPTDIETLVNLLLGVDDGAAALPAATGVSVRTALERAVLPALQRPPCLVSFSGGRDSSAVLAVTTDVARRHGLPDPVPATMRFPGAPATEESHWQALVVEHLGLTDHLVVALDEELDALGTAATDQLLRHGLRWPANSYMHRPLLEHARGGSLLTGAGGDELFATRGSRAVLVLRRHERLRRSDVRTLARAALPRPLRERAWTRSNRSAHRWLTAEGGVLVDRALAREQESWPLRWDRSVEHWHRTRACAALDAAVATVASDLDVLVGNPLLDPLVLAEVALVGGPTGFRSRDDAMRRLFGDLLPEPVLTRASKAAFGGAVWGPRVREFAQDWTGSGVDPQLVDIDGLRAEWLRPSPDFRTMLLLHRSWLEGRRPQPPASSSARSS